MLVGLTGRNASGKSTFVEWFSAKGLRSVSCSDSIRAWLAEQGIESTREALIDGGRELRRQGGGGVLAEMLLEILSGEDAVVARSGHQPRWRPSGRGVTSSSSR